jgi:hypothetical protein
MLRAPTFRSRLRTKKRSVDIRAKTTSITTMSISACRSISDSEPRDPLQTHTHTHSLSASPVSGAATSRLIRANHVTSKPPIRLSIALPLLPSPIFPLHARLGPPSQPIPASTITNPALDPRLKSPCHLIASASTTPPPPNTQQASRGGAFYNTILGRF